MPLAMIVNALAIYGMVNIGEIEHPIAILLIRLPLAAISGSVMGSISMEYRTVIFGK
jgi:hypothetical protein